MRVFVNAVAVEVARGAGVRDAVATHDAELGRKVELGTAIVTDARGIELPSDAALAEGAILRVVVSARRAARDADGDE